MNDNIRQHRETLPCWQWFSAEARYFLADREERETIRIYLSAEFGPFSDPIIRQWEEDRD